MDGRAASKGCATAQFNHVNVNKNTDASLPPCLDEPNDIAPKPSVAKPPPLRHIDRDCLRLVGATVGLGSQFGKSNCEPSRLVASAAKMAT